MLKLNFIHVNYIYISYCGFPLPICRVYLYFPPEQHEPFYTTITYYNIYIPTYFYLLYEIFNLFFSYTVMITFLN